MDMTANNGGFTQMQLALKNSAYNSVLDTVIILYIGTLYVLGHLLF